MLRGNDSESGGGYWSSKHSYSPKLLACTKFRFDKWTGPNFITANGSVETPLGAANISVPVHSKVANGKAVMQMEGIDLLLRNDFLKQFVYCIYMLIIRIPKPC